METPYQYEDLRFPYDLRLIKLNPQTTSSDTPTALKSRGENSTTVSFDLVTTNLQEAPPYETVSYVWGDSQQDARLSIGSAGYLSVTSLLLDSLPRLASAADTSYLWIDQICMNQKSSLEKNHQVRIMRWIYRRSQRVLIYLAPDLYPTNIRMPIWQPDEERFVRSGAKVCFDRIVNTFLAFQSSDQYNQAGMDDLTFENSMTARTKVSVSDEDAIAIAQLFFCHPWFFRGWVVQEVVLSPMASFVTCGYVFKAEDRERVFRKRPSYPNDGTDDHHDPLSGYNRFQDMVEWGAEDPLWVLDNYSPTSNFRLLQDHVFGLLGVMDRVNLQADYSLAAHEVFTLATAHIIEADGTLRVFGRLHRGHRPQSIDSASAHGLLDNLPSWVPCWALPRPPTLARTEAFESDLEVCAHRKHVLSATSSLPYLRVRGGRIGQVSKIDLPTSDGIYKDLASYMKTRVQHTQDSEKSGFQEAQPDIIKSLLLNIGNNLALLWSMLARFVDQLDPVPAAFDEGVLQFAELYRGHQMSGEHSPSSPELERVLSKSFEEFMKFADHSIDFHLDDERKGSSWGNPNVANGDIVCILHGLFMPIVLRPLSDSNLETPSKFQVISLCTVKGSMDGEAVHWEEDEAEEFVLC